jgi:hypothetical protein
MRSFNSNMPQPLERFLASVGLAVCVVITIASWSSVSAQQTMWPLPGLYFIELVLLSVVSAGMFLRNDRRRSAVTWAVAGAFSGFVVIAAWSIGLFYLPVTVLFGLSAIVSDRRSGQNLVRHLVLCVIAGIAQAALMLLAIRVLYPGAIF